MLFAFIIGALITWIIIMIAIFAIKVILFFIMFPFIFFGTIIKELANA